jgi:hypothetical protein
VAAEGSAVNEPYTAVDAIRDVADVLAVNGFDVLRRCGQSLTYRMPNGDRIELRATKKRGA